MELRKLQTSPEYLLQLGAQTLGLQDPLRIQPGFKLIDFHDHGDVITS